MPPSPDIVPVLPSDREYLITRRQIILIELAAIERRLGMSRSVPSKREQEQEAWEQRQGKRPT